MAVGDVKATYFFQTLKPPAAGWTENWYMTGFPNLDNGLIAAVSAGYTAPRIGILSADYVLTHARVVSADPGVKGASRVIYLDTASGTGKLVPPGSLIDYSEEPYDALLIRFELPGGRRRPFLMRGLPSQVVAQVASFQMPVWWQTPFNLWSANMVSGTSPLKSRITSLGTEDVWDSVGVSSIDNRSLILTKAAGLPAGYTVGATFKITLPAAAPNLTGFYHVKTVGVTTITTQPARSSWPAFTPLPALTRLATYSYQVPTGFTQLRGVKRSTGRPFDLLRGQRRRVRR